ncbi:MAG: FAD-dependent oxidoreductase, partial [Planctomycetota bacterium]
MEEISYGRKVPVRWEADVAVLGGGIAGVSAACAAAETGASVVLAERFAVAGGMMTAGGVNNFCGETSGQGRVFDRIVSGLEAFGAIDPHEPYRHFETRRRFDHEVLAVVLQRVLEESGVRLLLHTRFVDAVAADGQVSAVVLRGQSGPEALRARQYVDCTGEGELAHLAGFATMKGRESDGLQLPMSLMYFVREVAAEDFVTQIPEGFVEPIRSEEGLPMTSVWPGGPGGRAVKVKVTGFDSTDTEGLTSAELAARRQMLRVLDFHQRAGGKR